MSKLFIISGPSGVGKDTIMEGVIKKIPSLKRAISYTDRKKRADDKPDSYHFVSKEEFDRLVKEGEIFEWEYARDEKRYGSSKKEVLGLLEKGINLIKIVGPKSFENIKKLFGDKVVGIFIKYENIELLKQRIKKNRPDESVEDLKKRYNQAFLDMTFEKYYDYSVVNPEGNPKLAIDEIEKIIKEHA